MSMDRRKVYYFCWPEEKEYTGLACDCHLHEDDHPGETQLWFLSPPDRGHMIDGELVRHTEDGFIFRASLCYPGEWIFRELTIEEFRRKIYRHVEEGSILAQVIHTTDDLHEWYRKAFNFPRKY